MGAPKQAGTTTTTTKQEPWEGQQPFLKSGFESISNLYTKPSQADQTQISSLQSQLAALQGQSNAWKPTGGSGVGSGRGFYGSRGTSRETNPYTGQITALNAQLAAAQNPTSRLVTGDALPDYYPGQAIATDSPETQLALQARAGRAITGSPLIGAAQNELTRTLSGDYLNNNPYVDRMYNSAAKGVTNKYNEIVNPGIDSAFTRGGRFGSGAYASARNTADRTAASELGDLASNIYGTNYANERRLQNQGMLYAGELAGLDYADIDQLSSVGDYRTNLAQQQIDADRAKYEYNANKDETALQRYMQLIQGDYGGTTTQNNPYYRNSTAQNLGLLGQLGSAGAAIYMASDINLKENIVPRGQENGHNIYEYNYRGQPERWIGVMAQEVRNTHPEAVIDTAEGLKVNYDAIGVAMRRA
jgi:hypothetical protein